MDRAQLLLIFNPIFSKEPRVILSVLFTRSTELLFTIPENFQEKFLPGTKTFTAVSQTSESKEAARFYSFEKSVELSSTFAAACEDCSSQCWIFGKS